MASDLQRLSARCPERIFASRWAPHDPRIAEQRLMLKAQQQQQHIVADTDCHLAHSLQLLAGGRTSDSATHARLRGLHNAFWLMLGTSIDHMLVRDLCPMLKSEKRYAEANASAIYGGSPGSTPLRLDYCTIAPLNLTLGLIGHRGLTTLALTANESLQAARFAEIDKLLARTFTSRASASPDFVSFSGIEWDFKQWGLQRRARPVSDADWQAVRRAIAVQVEGARRAWPRLRAIFLRTQYPTSYRWYKDWVDVEVSEFAKYNAVIREVGHADLSARAIADGHDCTAHGTVRLKDAASSGECGVHSPGRWCGRLVVLDAARLFTCSAELGYPGGCTAAAGWTVDGMHPVQWALRGYFDAAINVLADFGGVCARDRAGAAT